jgi:hypothetical protein
MYGAFMVRANTWWLAHKKKMSVIKDYPIGEVAAVALVTVLFKYPIMYLRCEFHPPLLCSSWAAGIQVSPLAICLRRISTSDMIHMMFSECKPDSEDYLWCVRSAGAGDIR